jgi:hypothetical protein
MYILIKCKKMYRWLTIATRVRRIRKRIRISTTFVSCLDPPASVRRQEAGGQQTTLKTTSSKFDFFAAELWRSTRKTGWSSEFFWWVNTIQN